MADDADPPAPPAPPPPPPTMSADTLLMHPALAWANPLTRVWTSYVRLPEPDSYTSDTPDRHPDRIAEYGLSVQSVADTLQRWLVRRRVSVWETRRGLIDTRHKKILLVDFVCQLGRRCHLICLFYGNRRAWEPRELEYAGRIKRLARETYRCDARVLAVKVYGDGRVFSRVIPEPAAQNAEEGPV